MITDQILAVLREGGAGWLYAIGFFVLAASVAGAITTLSLKWHRASRPLRRDADRKQAEQLDACEKRLSAALELQRSQHVMRLDALQARLEEMCERIDTKADQRVVDAELKVGTQHFEWIAARLRDLEARRPGRA